MSVAAPGGALTLADDLALSRMGYGAMRLAGPGVFGPPKDWDEAIAVLRTAVDLGITHIDTSGFYGPATVNEVIRLGGGQPGREQAEDEPRGSIEDQVRRRR